MNASRVKVADDAKSKSYYHFFEREIADIPEQKLEFLKNPYGKLGAGLEIADRNKIFDAGELPDEMGIYPLTAGGFVVSNRTQFVGSKGSMLQWYFGWHALDPLRYAIWDCYDHYGLEISDEDRAYISDPKTSVPDKCRNVLHHVHESLIPGTDPVYINIHFADPADLGYDISKIYTDQCSFIVCANVEIETPEGIPNLPVVMLHMARDNETGCDMRTRFWIGYQIIDGVGKCLVPPEMTEDLKPLIADLLAHNFQEFTNLSVILPELYEQEKDNI